MKLEGIKDFLKDIFTVLKVDKKRRDKVIKKEKKEDENMEEKVMKEKKTGGFFWTFVASFALLEFSNIMGQAMNAWGESTLSGIAAVLVVGLSLIVGAIFSLKK